MGRKYADTDAKKGRAAMRRIIAFAIGVLITFFILNIIAERGLKITRSADASEIEEPKEVQPEAKPEFKLPWKTFSEVASEALNVDPVNKVCHNSGEEFSQYIFVHDGNKYGYAALNNRWAIYFYKENKIVFMWIGRFDPSSDDIVPTWAMPAPEIKLIFPNICDWFVQPDA